MPSERRRRLVQVAAQEFANAGYGGASLNRIIEACGVSKSSFYYVIDSKAELLEFVLQELIAEIAGDLRVPQLEEFSGAQYWQRVEEFVAEVATVTNRNPTAHLLGRIYYSSGPGADDGVLASMDGWVEELMLVGRRCGAVRCDLPEDVQRNLVFRMLQVFDEWTRDQWEQWSADELDRIVDVQFDVLKRVLAADVRQDTCVNVEIPPAG